MLKRFSKILRICLVASAFIFSACTQSLVISNVDYSQPVETVLTPDNQGTVTDVQHGLTFNILPLQYSETRDTTSVTTKEVRLIRGSEGYYYITAPGYKHVYVMEPEHRSLRLKKQILVSENGISKPAFNQREPYIQLVNRETKEMYQLTAKGVQKKSEQEKMAEEASSQ